MHARSKEFYEKKKKKICQHMGQSNNQGQRTVLFLHLVDEIDRCDYTILLLVLGDLPKQVFKRGEECVFHARCQIHVVLVLLNSNGLSAGSSNTGALIGVLSVWCAGPAFSIQGRRWRRGSRRACCRKVWMSIAHRRIRVCRLRCEKLSSADLWKVQYALSKWLAEIKSLNDRVAIAVGLHRLV